MFCELQDCGQECCHHCFPVKKCSLSHSWCKLNGQFREIMHKNRILVTGCAGFIGSHVCERLLIEGYEVIGIDNFDPYYDLALKERNVDILSKYATFTFRKDDIRTTKSISEFRPCKVIHLASMAGVRTSIENPKVYVQVNIEGFIHILEECVKNDVLHIVYASSSSVYGTNEVPFREDALINACNSPYAASKRAMEVFAQTYSTLYALSCIGLRFFTVYGPRGRPDMAPRKFIEAISNGRPIEKYGDGSSSRDYTHVYDIVEGIMGALRNSQQKKCEVYNLGNSQPITLNEFISCCEKACGKEAIVIEKGNQMGDVPRTYACIDKAKEEIGYCPKIKLQEGLLTLLEN